MVLCLQAALDRFAFMTPTTALGVIIALQPLALLKKHIQVPLQTVDAELSTCFLLFCGILCFFLALTSVHHV